jgi:hypothetical protein
MDSAWAASERAATCSTVGVSSPAILYMFGIMRSRPREAVNVVASAPACRAPASLCISTTDGTVPQMLGRPSVAHWSAHSPIGEEGVMG